MTNYQSVDYESDDYDTFTYTNRLDFYPFDMVGYTFIGWTSFIDNGNAYWDVEDEENFAYFTNCISFVANISTSDSYAYN